MFSFNSITVSTIKEKKNSILNFLEGHNAIDSRVTRGIVLLAFSYLHAFLSATDVEVVGPVGLEIKLDFTPLEHMDTWEHFGWLAHHYVKFIALLIDLSRLECIELRLVFRNKFIADWTKVVIVGMIDEAHIGIV